MWITNFLFCLRIIIVIFDIKFSYVLNGTDMLIKTFSGAVSGIEAEIITVEVNVSRGIKFYLVG